MKKIFLFILCCVLLFTMVSCGRGSQKEEKRERTDDIIVLFTNDVHCCVDENIGYSGLAAYKKSLAERTPYLTLVDCGDAVQGSYMGTVSKGEMPIQIMNEVSYDLAIFGNHEFDYGMDRLSELLSLANAEYLCCNVTYSGSGNTPLSLTKPYEILEYGPTKVAFIGVTTPNSIQTSTPSYFQENGEYVYDFGGKDGETLYSTVQKYIDECIGNGADYVILLTHMGVNENDSPFTSYELVRNTKGVDAVLDGHSHTEIPTRVEKNMEGEDVLIAQTGTNLLHIGQLVISPSGFITIGYISDYTQKDTDTDAFIGQISTDLDEMMNTVVATLGHDMTITDEEGIRIVRSRETAIGNFVADAYRYATGADIGYTNGGGVRTSLLAGDITYEDLINVCPFGNMICMVEVTGQDVLDMLECFYSTTCSEYAKDGEAYGENGSFGQFSGLKCTVCTDIPTSIELSDDGMLIGIGERRRVSDVMILRNGEYVPIDPKATYTFAGTDYVIKKGGCGMGVLMADHNIILDSIGTDYQILVDYVKTLNNDFSAYEGPEGRIIIAAD